MNPDHITRRRLLEVSSVTAIGGIAGCSGGDDGGGGPTATTVADVTNSISVSDVETDDRTVVVDGATIDEDGWVALHPENESGGPNRNVTLGQAQLSAGDHSDVEVEMHILHAGEQTVYAMLHYDDPADGEFTFPNGDQPVTEGGSAVAESFSLTLTGEVTPSLSVTDQESTGQAINVPGAAIDGAGWLVLHPEADGGGPDGSTTLAARALQAGLYADVGMELEQPLADSQTLYAMLHYDDPADGEFTFPDEGDPGVTADGEAVVEPFEVTVTPTVEIPGRFFEPIRISIDPGQTVQWVSRSSEEHDVTSVAFDDQGAEWDFSETLPEKGDRATHTFESEGIYQYECTIHGSNAMCGAVLVGDVSLSGKMPCESFGGGVL